jgi:hypothetical protein
MTTSIFAPCSGHTYTVREAAALVGWSHAGMLNLIRIGAVACDVTTTGVMVVGAGEVARIRAVASY